MSVYSYKAELRSTSHGYTLDEVDVTAEADDAQSARELATGALPQTEHGHIWVLRLTYISVEAKVGTAT